MTWKPQPPPVHQLSKAQYDGWACCWCGKALWSGAVSAGISRGRQGACVLDIEVHACPGCAPTPTISRPSPGPDPEERDGAVPSTPRATVHTRRNT